MSTHFTPRDRGEVEEIKIALQQLEKDYMLDLSTEKEWLDGLNERFNQPSLPQGLDKPRTIGRGIHKQEYTGCDMSWMDESQRLDEAAEEYANQDTVVYATRKKSFKSGAKWMAEQGETNPYSPVESAPGENSYASTGFALQFNDERTFKPYQSIKKILALGFMKVLDEIRPENKMCLSNGECMDIEKAFDERDWDKLERYLKKYSPATK